MEIKTLSDIIVKYQGKIKRLKTRYELNDPDDSARDKALMRKRYEAFQEIIEDIEKIDRYYDKIIAKAFLAGIIFSIIIIGVVYYFYTH